MKANRPAVERALRKLEKHRPERCRQCWEPRSIQDAWFWGPLCDTCFQRLLFSIEMPRSLFGRKA